MSMWRQVLAGVAGAFIRAYGARGPGTYGLRGIHARKAAAVGVSICHPQVVGAVRRKAVVARCRRRRQVWCAIQPSRQQVKESEVLASLCERKGA